MSTVDSLASVVSYRNLTNRTFSFEEDLFLGPVYRRLLISRLCEDPAGQSRLRSTSTVSGDATQTHDQGEATCHNDDVLAIELRQQGIFSRSCYEDYCEFMGLHRPRKMTRRHLPLASVLCQHEHRDNEQKDIDDRFFEAIRCRRLRDIANALDEGADINIRRDGKTALELCVESWAVSKAETPSKPSEDTTVAEFLMLYKETHIPYSFGRRLTILHLCMHIGANAEFMRPFFDVEAKTDALGSLDIFGRSVLHTAVLCSSTGLYAILQLKRLFGDVVVQPNYIYDLQGVSALDFASQTTCCDLIHTPAVGPLFFNKQSCEHTLALATLAGDATEGYSRPSTGISQVDDSEDEQGHASAPAVSLEPHTLRVFPTTSENESFQDQSSLFSSRNEQSSCSKDKEVPTQQCFADAIVSPDLPFADPFMGMMASRPIMTGQQMRRRWSICLAEEINRIDPIYNFPRQSSHSQVPNTDALEEVLCSMPNGRPRALSDQPPASSHNGSRISAGAFAAGPTHTSEGGVERLPPFLRMMVKYERRDLLPDDGRTMKYFVMNPDSDDT